MKRFSTPVLWLFIAVLVLVILASTDSAVLAAVSTESSGKNLAQVHSMAALDNSTATPTATVTRTATATATRRLSTPTRTVTTTVASSAIFTTTATVTLTPSITATTAATATATATATETVSGTLEPSPTPTITPTPTQTPYRYPLSLDANVLSISSLRARPYLRGTIKITRVVSDEKTFRRTLIEYVSDGLRITGMMNIPQGIGPFPVVVLDHGYFPPAQFKSGDGTMPAADVFAQNGYLTIASDYRCYAGSQCGANTIDVGYAIDVLNLIAALPSLSYADTSRVGIWGHSMGGGVTMRVLAINNTIKVAALYGAVSSDDEVHYCWLAGCGSSLVTPVPRNTYKLEQFDQDFNQGLPTPSAADSPTDYRGKLHQIFLRSSPSRYLSDITTPIIIHHGEADDTVPIQWSVDLTDQLNALGKPATLYTYPGENHVFVGWGWQLFMSRTLSFFDSYLNPRATPITVEKRVLQRERVASESNY